METNRVSFQVFKDFFIQIGCFTTEQVLLWKQDFSLFNLSRWTKEGRLLRIKRNLYTFPEIAGKPESHLLFSSVICRPSYISLHYALHYYEIIPEEVVQVTAVTSLKTQAFDTDIGYYAYQSVKEKLMFGFELHDCIALKGARIPFARPEKAVLDLLYLYPQYNTRQSMVDLRFDESFMEEDFDWQRFDSYLDRAGSAALSRRASLFQEVYRGQ